VGPFQSGKTTLLEAILARTGAIKNAGSVDAGTSVGDASPEARHHKMGVGLSAATTTFMGDSYTFIDCPGSIEFAHDMRAALPAVDAAVVEHRAEVRRQILVGVRLRVGRRTRGAVAARVVQHDAVARAFERARPHDDVAAGGGEAMEANDRSTVPTVLTQQDGAVRRHLEVSHRRSSTL